MSIQVFFFFFFLPSILIPISLLHMRIIVIKTFGSILDIFHSSLNYAFFKWWMEYMFSPKEAGRANQEVQFGKVASQVGRFFLIVKVQ